MIVTMTGQQWKAFYADETYWPEGRYHDDQIVHLNGTASNVPVSDHLSVKDTDEVSVTYGDVLDKGNVYVADLVEYAKEWLDKVTKTQLLVQCPDDKVSAVIEAILEAGGEVTRRTKSKDPLKAILDAAPEVRYMGDIPSSFTAHAQSLDSKSTDK